MKKRFGNPGSTVEAGLEEKKKGLANAAARRAGNPSAGRGGGMSGGGLANADSVSADRTKRFQTGLANAKALQGKPSAVTGNPFKKT